MTITASNLATEFNTVLAARRSARRLHPGVFPPTMGEELKTVTQFVPSSFDAQPWRVVVLDKRNEAFWDMVSGTIEERLEGDR